MTQEEQSLLLKDLSARLSDDIICQVDDGAAGLNDGKLVEIDISKGLVRFDADYYWDAYIDDVKPYLRPMSSMTEEEISDLQKINSQFNFNKFDNFAYVGAADDGFCSVEEMYNILNYLNSKHLDYRGMIPMDLAIEVTKENNPYKD